MDPNVFAALSGAEFNRAAPKLSWRGDFAIAHFADLDNDLDGFVEFDLRENEQQAMPHLHPL
ncbi:MAG: hypothetical protein OXE97_12115 [Gammaproteobacteria bacterium]|nr:hypothetical protein [Gammaproteobacteria bacterium]